MIGAAADQMAEILDLLSAAARVEDQRFEPRAQPANTRQLAEAAADRLPEGAASVVGEGATVTVDPTWAAVSLSGIAEAARRHGGLDRIGFSVEGATVEIAPIVDGAGAVATGQELRDFAAAVGVRLLREVGAAVELDGDRLSVRFRER
jgi:hypothetical protein